MAPIKPADRLVAFVEARRQLQGIPIPPDEFDRTAEEVVRSNPSARGQRFFALLMDRAIENHIRAAGSLDD